MEAAGEVPIASFIWDGNDDTHRSNGYRIDRMRDEGKPWRLSLEHVKWPEFATRARRDGQRFGSLRSARSAAIHMEVVRVRSAKLIRHIVLALVLFAASVVFYSVMNVSGESSRIEWFAASLVSMTLAWSEALNAFILAISEGWDYGYEVPRLSRIDRGVSGLAIWLFASNAAVPDETDNAPIRIVSVT